MANDLYPVVEDLERLKKMLKPKKKKEIEKGVCGGVLVDKTIKQAREAFEEHKMKEVGPGHWHLAKEGTLVHWCDIVVMGGVGLAVWGDIDGLFFSYYSGAKKPEELVHWMAKFDAWYYCRQKAIIGMGGDRETVDDYNDDVAIYDLLESLQDAPENYGDDWDDPMAFSGEGTIKSVYTDAISEAVRSISNGEVIQVVMQELHDALSDVDSDAWEWLGSVGRIPSTRLIFVLAAVERLSLILKENK